MTLVAPQLAASGTADVVIDTPMTLATLTTAGYYTLEIDTVQLLIAEFIRVIVSVKTLTGGTSRVLYDNVFQGGRAETTIVWPPVAADIEFKVTLEQTELASARDFPWKITAPGSA